MLLSKGRRLGGRGVSLVVATVVVLALLGTVAYAAVRPGNDDAAKQFLQRSGRVRISNSRGDDALVGMQGMLPGDRRAGTVKIGNASKVRARFYLGLSKLVETTGAGGGRLSYRLVLTVKRLSTTAAATARLLRSAAADAARSSSATSTPRGDAHLPLRRALPRGGASMDDRFQRATTSLQFNWYARRAR